MSLDEKADRCVENDVTDPRLEKLDTIRSFLEEFFQGALSLKDNDWFKMSDGEHDKSVIIEHDVVLDGGLKVHLYLSLDQNWINFRDKKIPNYKMIEHEKYISLSDGLGNDFTIWLTPQGLDIHVFDGHDGNHKLGVFNRNGLSDKDDKLLDMILPALERFKKMLEGWWKKRGTEVCGELKTNSEECEKSSPEELAELAERREKIHTTLKSLKLDD